MERFQMQGQQAVRMFLAVAECLTQSRSWSWRLVEQSLTPHPTQYRSFRRRSSQPITWLILTNKAVQENKHAKTKYKSDKANNLKKHGHEAQILNIGQGFESSGLVLGLERLSVESKPTFTVARLSLNIIVSYQKNEQVQQANLFKNQILFF